MKNNKDTIFWVIGVILLFVVASYVYSKSVPALPENLSAKIKADDNNSKYASKITTPETTTVNASLTEAQKKTETNSVANSATKSVTNSAVSVKDKKNDKVVEPAIATSTATSIHTVVIPTQALPTPINSSDINQGGPKSQPSDFILKDLDGKDVKLTDYRGKIVILNFWATWCGYCVKEMPDLNELNETFVKDNDVVILAIDVQENADRVMNFVYSNDIGLKVLLDTDGAVSSKYGITGFPTTFFVNRNGEIETSISGMTNKEAIMKVINKMKSK